MAKRQSVNKKTSATRTTTTSSSRKKSSPAKNGKRSTRKSIRKNVSPASLVSDAVRAMRSQGEEDVRALSTALFDAQRAQESLNSAYGQLEELETQQEEVFAQAIAEIESERDSVRDELTSAQTVQNQENKDLIQAAKNLRSAANVLCNIPDPLTPLIDGDDDADVLMLREQLRALVDRKNDLPDNALALSDIIVSCKELGDILNGRVKLQINRVKSARKDIDQLTTSRNKLDSECEQLTTRNDSLSGELDQTQSSLQVSENLVSQLREDIESAKQRYANLESDKDDTEATAQAEHEELQQELDGANGRGDELSRKLKDSRELARKTERATVDLAEIVLALADADVAMTQISEVPPMSVARDELESLIGDAGDDWDDEVDNLFRDDLGDDIVSSARTVSDSVGARRKVLVHTLVEHDESNQSLNEQNDEQQAHIAEMDASLQELEAALNTGTAQLESVTEEVEALSNELGERVKELGDAHSEIAQLSIHVEALTEKAEEGKVLKAELKTCNSELNALHKAHDKQGERGEQAGVAQRELARHLVDLAGATESALAMSSHKSASRFTKTYKKLDDTAAQADSDILRVIKTSLDVVEKLHTRVSQLTHDLHQKGESLEGNEKTIADLERRFSKESKTLTECDGNLKTLKLDNQELNKTAKKAAKLEGQLEKRDAQLAQSEAKLKETAAELLETQADFDEVLAREEESMNSLSAEMGDIKKRLQDEQKSRRDIESGSSDDRDDYESRLTTIQTTAEELGRNLEERDDHIIELQSELDEAGEQRARIAELEHRGDTLADDLEVALAKTRELEGELDNKEAVETLEEELRDARNERDELISKVRSLDKRIADEKGAAASVKSKNDSLQKKIDDKAALYRRDIDKLQAKYDEAMEDNRRNKVKLAGMAARTRRTTMGS